MRAEKNKVNQDHCDREKEVRVTTAEYYLYLEINTFSFRLMKKLWNKKKKKKKREKRKEFKRSYSIS